MSAEVITVVLVEDNAEQSAALYQLIKGSPGFQCLKAFANGEEALTEIPDLRPDVILMDIHLPGISGTECVAGIKTRLPAAKIMMLTVFEDHDRIFEALKAGATGYLLKKTPPARLLEAIPELHEGGAPMSGPIARQVVAAFQQPPPQPCEAAGAKLSDREREILELLTRGFLYKEIADRLAISLGAVRTHIGHIYEKLHVHTRAEAMIRVLRPR